MSLPRFLTKKLAMGCFSFLGPLKPKRKLYKHDPSVPVPKSTSWFRRKKPHLEARAPERDSQSTSFTESLHVDENVGEVPHPISPFAQDEVSDKDMPEDVSQHNSSISDSSSSCSLSLSSASFSFSSSGSEDDSDNEYSDEKLRQDSNSGSEDTDQELNDSDVQSLALAAFVTRHNLTGRATFDLCELIKVLSPNSEKLSKLSPKDIAKVTESMEITTVDYCHVCGQTFPSDKDVFECPIDGCMGLRYKGGQRRQTRQSRIPRCSFILGDCKSQLSSILQRKGMWDKIQMQKTKAKENLKKQKTELSDVIFGNSYRSLTSKGGFLESENHISGIFNTDGVQLYSSSAVKQWPIYLAINEIPIEKRFAKENCVLAGLWQGKGQPPYYQYMKIFGENMTELYDHGFEVDLQGTCRKRQVKFAIILCTVDLPAKCKILNMTQYNGQYGCITCEEPGKRALQGRGSTQCYPYRPEGEQSSMRQSKTLKELAHEASINARIKGVIGPSGLSAMHWFDYVSMVVPDYMHGCLLGVTKVLMQLWFSPTNSKQPYFIGKHLKEINRTLSAMKPPDYVERLPRNLEQNYSHFKASEYQAWLLYYAIPCLKGYLGDKYLIHFALFSEAIFILLNDMIDEDDLLRAEGLLRKFYEQFSELYKEGSCGLNVHNVGCHLVHYVTEWGPLYCWSAFGFEDINGQLLRMVHGTGDVTNQLMQMKQIDSAVNCADMKSAPVRYLDFIKATTNKKRPRKLLAKADNCVLLGTAHPVDEKFFSEEEMCLILNATKCCTASNLRGARRIIKGETRYYAKSYSRMTRRVCYIMQLKDGRIAEVLSFIWSMMANTVFALVRPYVLKEQPYLLPHHAKHIFCVKPLDSYDVVSVDQIREKLFFLGSKYVEPCLARMPNLYGHGVIN